MSRTTDRLQLEDGSRVAVIGSGAAGSLFSIFLLEMVDRIGVEIELTVFEPKDFSSLGPSGCNMCGGIVSESLVQSLAAEGINLPPSVVQRGIEAYVLHTDAGSVRIDTPLAEKRIAAVHRGAGPLKAPPGERQGFDGFLLQLVLDKGASLVPEAVTDISWTDGRPQVTRKSGQSEPFDLLVVATGVNSPALKKLFSDSDYVPPGITRTAIRELYLGEDKVSTVLGDAMHLFLVDLPRLQFAAIIPKGNCATLCVLGDKINKSLLKSLMDSAPVQNCLGSEVGFTEACGCAPHIVTSAATNPYGDRLVFVGDCGVSRLNKDGIGAAYKTAKAAATTVAFKGVSRSDFEQGYWKTCRSIMNDNRYGRLIFGVTHQIQKSLLLQRAVLRMVQSEQTRPGAAPRMSTVLWDTFSGSAPYKEIFMRTLDPRFMVGLIWNLLASLVPPRQADSHVGEEVVTNRRSE